VAPDITFEVAEAAVWQELDELKTALVPAPELEKVKNRFESEFYFRNLGGENLSNNLALAELRGDARLHLKEVDSYRTVTAEAVRATARELFRRGNASVLHYAKKG
jgi:predicted Zn-dependent peptidase